MNKEMRKTSLALVALSFVLLASSAVSPALANVNQAYPHISPVTISMLSTLPSLLSVPTTLICGRKLAHGTSYRLAAMLGIAIMLVGGIAPAFTENFYMLLVWRGLFGIGDGMLRPISMPVLMSYFTGPRMTAQAGLNTVFINLGAIVFQMLGGVTCTHFGWRATFLIYLLVLPSLLLVAALLPEPKTAPHKAEPPMKSEAILRHVVKWCMFYCCHMILFYVSVTETSAIVKDLNFGTAATAALVLSVITAGGAVGGALYPKLSHWHGRVLTVAFAILGLGYFLMWQADRLAFLAIAAGVVGIGFGITMAAITVLVGSEVTDAERSTAASFMQVFGSIGSFASKFIISWLCAAVSLPVSRKPYLLCVAGYIVLILATILAAKGPKTDRDNK